MAQDEEWCGESRTEKGDEHGRQLVAVVDGEGKVLRNETGLERTGVKRIFVILVRSF